MSKLSIALQPSECALVAAAAQIYAAYVTTGRVVDGDESKWIERSIQEAIRIARTIDDSVQADGEFH